MKSIIDQKHWFLKYQTISISMNTFYKWFSLNSQKTKHKTYVCQILISRFYLQKFGSFELFCVYFSSSKFFSHSLHNLFSDFYTYTDIINVLFWLGSWRYYYWIEKHSHPSSKVDILGKSCKDIWQVVGIVLHLHTNFMEFIKNIEGY